MKRGLRALAAGSLLSLSIAARGQTCTPLRIEQVGDGFIAPVGAACVPGDDRRLFVVEQDGRIRILNLADGSINAIPFLDIDELVTDNRGEQGLLGLAFHPEYATTRFLYVYYIDNDGHTVIARYKTFDGDPDRADPDSAKIILTQEQPFPHHNAGMLAFGPNDGYFYAALGDGGNGGDPGNRAQNLETLLGKLIRIDVNVDPQPYAIPPTNPFFSDPDARGEIWALGLRNPWRFSFDRQNGDLYIGDVGQATREEINFQPGQSPGGENYGWRCMEGTVCTGLSGCECNHESLTMPVVDHDRTEAACIIGGYVYRGRKIPDARGTYFYADFSVQRVYSLRVVSGKLTDWREWTDTLQPAGGIASFAEDAAGELYLVTRFGRVHRIVPDGLAHGDMNGDGDVDAFDVEPFVLALTDRNAYISMFPSIDPDDIGDLNCDGVLNAFDIEPFIAALVGS